MKTVFSIFFLTTNYIFIIKNEGFIKKSFKKLLNKNNDKIRISFVCNLCCA